MIWKRWRCGSGNSSGSATRNYKTLKFNDDLFNLNHNFNLNFKPSNMLSSSIVEKRTVRRLRFPKFEIEIEIEIEVENVY